MFYHSFMVNGLNTEQAERHTALKSAKALCVRLMEWDNVYVPGFGNTPQPRRNERNKRLKRVILHLEIAMHAICLARTN